LYVNELLYYVLKPQYPDPDLFDAYLLTIHGLVSAEDMSVIEALLRRFEWTLLNACGAAFSLSTEARTDTLIVADQQYQFIAGEGFICTTRGIPGSHLLALTEDNLSEPQYLKSAKIIMRQAIDHLLSGQEIKARALFAT